MSNQNFEGAPQRTSSQRPHIWNDESKIIIPGALLEGEQEMLSDPWDRHKQK